MWSAYSFIEAGRQLGYPDCCIDEFVNAIFPNGKPVNRKLAGTGYVPCYRCDKKYTEEELVANINKNRKTKVKFPDADFPEILKELNEIV